MNGIQSCSSPPSKVQLFPWKFRNPGSTFLSYHSVYITLFFLSLSFISAYRNIFLCVKSVKMMTQTREKYVAVMILIRKKRMDEQILDVLNILATDPRQIRDQSVLYGWEWEEEQGWWVQSVAVWAWEWWKCIFAIFRRTFRFFTASISRFSEGFFAV